MDEDRASYITRAIYDVVEATNLVEDLEERVDKYSIAGLFYKSGLLRGFEHEYICECFEQDDAAWESLMDGTADREALHKERVDNIEAFLFGGTCTEAIDGIIQWINSPDCDKNQLGRLHDTIDKYIRPTTQYSKFKAT